ncbi:PREDICTED: uncharacterized protein LOC106790403 isoform X1 [Polistes canadensis]|uniref:uncharacterized protein LOC106790403 isoform X1 n=1 Tax=Polistes canadensis TaxID=91411 RepID=UPI000718D147|nr:PREDICTED: uncharacterized protein LOC106790403 isoform X1 [Polistes canadensis]XP_014610752.1 PREDICTED: uncharacterized protein LOC106790403 isoform X1 [Polistes canadensis]
MPKTNAEKCKEYRKRKMLIKEMSSTQTKKVSVQTNAERCKAYRLRRKMVEEEHQLSVNVISCTPSTSNLLMTSGPSPQPVITATKIGFDKVVVKQERPDEAEIRELAAKMVEANKAKMVSAATAAGAGGGGSAQQRGAAGSQCLSSTQGNLPGILGYLNKRPADSTVAKTTGSNNSTGEGKIPLDDESQRGRFGWTSFDECHIPYIFRAGEKYCAVRILESKLLNKYLSYLHSDIYSCTCIRSYYITDAESRLFNEINMKHCDSLFGRDQFSCKDLVVRLSDAKEFYTFLDVCYTKLTAGASPNVSSRHKAEKCGFIRINKESVVPYTVKDGLQYVPLFYFEGETENLKLKAEKLEGWDLSYLKFCCKVQGIRNELFASETCSVISLSDIKSYFPPDTGFEDYWPNKVMDSQLLVSSKGGGGGGGWTRQPPTPPVSKTSSVQNNTSKASLNTRAGPLQTILPRGTSATSAQQTQRVSQPRQASAVTHPAHSSPSPLPTGRSSIASQPMLNVVQGVVNGWSGLVGGQPAFQTALVSQASSLIRTPPPLSMHNVSAPSKTYTTHQLRSRGGGGGATAQYPGVYPVTTMQAVAQAQPPPLVRATAHTSQPNLGYPTYGKDDWVTTTYTTPSLGVPDGVTARTYPQMIGLSEQVQALMPAPTTASTLLSRQQRHTPPVHNTSHTKYPPPLIPVNGGNNSSRDTRGRKALINIAEPSISNCQAQPYQVQKALIEDKMVPCINFKPYIYSELLMTLPDFVSNYFPACDINSCRQVLTDVLNIDLYQGNRLQMKMLMDAGKCSSLNEELPLIQVGNIMKYMPQFKYMFNRDDMVMPAPPAHSSEEHQPKKRQRTS